MKRLVVCCDGTWQSLYNKWPTNIQRIANFVQMTAGDVTQILYYDAGVGVGNVMERIAGGVFGKGLDDEIQQAYKFLSMNYEPGDEIYLFGFSRGAYTVRSLGGLLRSCGIVERNKLNLVPKAMDLYRDNKIGPSDQPCIRFRRDNSADRSETPPIIHFLGCFDTVGSLGIPTLTPIIPMGELLGPGYEFHDTQLNSYIRHARHAVAVDEERQDFDVTRMSPPGTPLSDHSLKEVWFPGTHGCVGGGDEGVSGLSDGPLRWMIDEARACGLSFNEGAIAFYLQENPLIAFEPNSETLFGHFRPIASRKGPDNQACLSPQVLERIAEIETYRPPALRHLFDWPE